MDRTARVARTAHDLKHSNRLGLPEFGVRKLYLAAQGKQSRTHLPPTAPPEKKKDPGTDDFCFAPGPQLDAGTWTVDPARKDPVKLVYSLHNPVECIKKATLELFHRFQEKPVWTRELKDEELTHGDHELRFGDKQDTVEWDGRIGLHPDFPDEYLTVEHSPYKLRLVVEGEGECLAPMAWTYFHVLADEVELEYGPEKSLPLALPGTGDSRKVLQGLRGQNGGLPPATGGKVRVHLESNLFTKGHSMFDDSLATEYRRLWGKGPLIPLFATVKVRGAAGKPVLAPKALGKVRFLWDWESRAAATGDTFVDQAQDYDAAKTKPRGQNCHVDRGGKRGPGGDPVFVATPGQAPGPLVEGVFPFQVEACTGKRTWAAYSRAWRDGKLACKTGILFQPSRMAGDLYTATVYVASDVDATGTPRLDVDSDAPLPAPKPLSASTGTFETRRKVHLVHYLKKRADVSTLTLATVCAVFQPSFLDLEDLSGTPDVVPQATWNAAVTTAVGRLGWGDFEKLMLDDGVDQHGAGPHGVHFRTRADFRVHWLRHELTRRFPTLSRADATSVARDTYAAASGGEHAAALAAATAAGYSATDAGLIATRAVSLKASIDTHLNNPANGMATDADYASVCESLAINVLIDIFDGRFLAKDGAHIFQVDGSHNLLYLQASLTDGMAHDFPNGSDSKCGFLAMGWPALYAGRPISAEQTAAHEFGHHFFLPHTMHAGEMMDYRAHDQSVLDCLMSYNAMTPRKVCGFCALRLRGWSKAALSPHGPGNRRT